MTIETRGLKLRRQKTDEAPRASGHLRAVPQAGDQGCYMRGEGGEQSMEKSRYWLEKAVFKKCDAARESLRGMDENPLSAQQMEFLKLFSRVVGPKTIQEGYRDHLL